MEKRAQTQFLASFAILFAMACALMFCCVAPKAAFAADEPVALQEPSGITAMTEDIYDESSVTQDGDADAGIMTFADEPVACIGEKEYSSLSDAIGDALNGDTVVLLDDVQLSAAVIISDKSITLDLNGHSITRGDGNETSYLFGVVAGASLIVQDTSTDGAGKIYSANFQKSDGNTYAGYGILTNGAVEVRSGTVSGYYGIYVSGPSADATARVDISGGSVTGANTAIIVNANRDPLADGETLDDKTAYPAIVNVSGDASISAGSWGITLWGKGAELNVSGSAQITAEFFAISGNGTYGAKTNESGTKINISGGTITATGENGTAIYHPQYGTMDISGGTISGASGIEVRAGEVTISGNAVIEGTGSPLDSDPNGSGTTTVGAGIAVVQHTTRLPISVTISGGTISGYVAVSEANLQNSSKEDIAKVSISISGGTFTSTNEGEDAQAIYSQDCKQFITGGTFSTDVDADDMDYVVPGNTAIQNDGGTYYIGVDTSDSSEAVAEVNGYGYTSIQSAIDAIAASDDKSGKISLIKDVTESIVVPKDAEIVLDLGGYKLTNDAGKDTITVDLGGSLTIQGTGTVDNVSHQCAAVFNNGTTKLEGGAYTRSAEASTSTDDANGNSYYNIVNHGSMTIEDGVSVTSRGSFSSLIDNGYYNYTSTNPRVGYVEGINWEAPELVINGGSFSGGINTIKNDDNATVTINGGTFSNVTKAAVFNCNKVIITGGTFRVSGDGVWALNNQSYQSGYNMVSAEISGGTFEGEVINESEAKMTISGGTFNADVTSENSDNIAISGGSFVSGVPSEYCAEGYDPTGAVLVDGYYTVCNHEGTWDEGVITTPATCTEGGVKTYTCRTCGQTKTEPIEALGHTWGDWLTIESPNCTDSGSEQRKCSVCGLTETRGLDATGHDWEADYTVDKEPTCTEEGSKSIHCKNCDAVKDSVVIDALGHSAADPVKENEKAATSTQAGSYDSVVYCSVCGEELSREAVKVDPLGVVEDSESESEEGADQATQSSQSGQSDQSSASGSEESPQTSDYLGVVFLALTVTAVAMIGVALFAYSRVRKSR